MEDEAGEELTSEKSRNDGVDHTHEGLKDAKVKPSISKRSNGFEREEDALLKRTIVPGSDDQNDTESFLLVESSEAWKERRAEDPIRIWRREGRVVETHQRHP